MEYSALLLFLFFLATAMLLSLVTELGSDFYEFSLKTRRFLRRAQTVCLVLAGVGWMYITLGLFIGFFMNR